MPALPRVGAVLMSYDRTIGRLRLRVTDVGARDHHSLEGVKLTINAATAELSVEELRDLKHLIERALYHAKRKS